MFPLILKYWEKSRAALINQLQGIEESVWAGDGRFDSMGHSAKYGCYTMLNCNLTKLVHFELLQVD
jgi:solute carrier family 8 (sodium/calcium exchanger)